MELNLNKVKLLDDERIDQLYSNDFRIIQSPNVFSFSIDAVLLANFANPVMKKGAKVVDLCAGNGAVGIFMSNKVNGEIIEVEIQERLANMAKRSIELNDLAEKISVINQDLNQLGNQIKKDSVDMITCNPPYFLNSDMSQKNENQHYAIARHEITVNLEQIIKVSSGLLKFGGKINFVYRPDRLLEMLDKMRKYNIEPKKIQMVHPKPGKEANMVLVQGIKAGKKGGLRYLYPITIADEKGQYTGIVRELLYGK